MMMLGQQLACASVCRSKSYMVISRGADATPRLLDFGGLAPMVAPHARYLCRRETGTGWTLLSMADFQRKYAKAPLLHSIALEGSGHRLNHSAGS